MIEQWREITDYPGYEVSSLGRVRSFWKRVSRGAGGGSVAYLSKVPTLLAQGPGNSGYLHVSMKHVSGRKYTNAVHVLVLRAFVGPAPAGMEACHENGNRRDNRFENLRWDTPKNNAADRIEHGTHTRGERQANSKLTETAALEVIRLVRTTLKTYDEIADQFGIQTSQVSRIANGKRWAHLNSQVQATVHRDTHGPRFIGSSVQ